MKRSSVPERLCQQRLFNFAWTLVCMSLMCCLNVAHVCLMDLCPLVDVTTASTLSCVVVAVDDDDDDDDVVVVEVLKSVKKAPKSPLVEKMLLLQ